MNHKRKIRAASSPVSRRLGRRTPSAENPMLLPNRSTPVIVQALTPSQIAAIPKSRFTVSVVGPEKTVRVADAVSIARKSAPNRRVGVVVKGLGALSGITEVPLPHHLPDVQMIDLDRSRPVRPGVRHAYSIKTRHVGYAGPQVVRNAGVGNDTEQTMITITQLTHQLYRLSQKAHEEVRAENRNNDDDKQPDSGLFYPPIDENKLSDCILKIYIDLFDADKKWRFFNKDYKQVEFCVMTHLYFKYIKVLSNESCLPFYLYLKKKVFHDAPDFTDKTFYNHSQSNKYVNLETRIKDTEPSLKVPPYQKSNDSLMDAFKKVGSSFHNSDYFTELREQRERLKTFKID